MKHISRAARIEPALSHPQGWRRASWTTEGPVVATKLGLLGGGGGVTQLGVLESPGWPMPFPRYKTRQEYMARSSIYFAIINRLKLGAIHILFLRKGEGGGGEVEMHPFILWFCGSGAAKRQSRGNPFFAEALDASLVV